MDTIPLSSFPAISLIILLVAIGLYRRSSRISISYIPGPPSDSILLGNLPEYFQSQAGEADFKWQEEYGDIVRIKASFGEDRLLISDPKALQYIHQTSGYRWFKPKERRELSRLISGRGILWAYGDDHKRHRKVMLPGFGGPEAKSFVPLFSACAARLASKWRDLISETNGQSTIVNIPHWASRATLDAIGEAAFDYQFGVLDNANNALGNAYANLFPDTFGSLSKRDIFKQTIMAHLPDSFLVWLGDYMPSKKMAHIRHTAQLATSVAKDLVDMKSEELLQGKGRRDVMSLLVKANASENSKTQLTLEELLAQMRTIIMAGHETTANTLSWALLELTQHPEMQTRLRQEIRQMERTIRARGDNEFTTVDFESMPYLSAFLKETLRFHPVAYTVYRETSKDDIIPLSKPIRTLSGDMITEIPVPKGQKILSSICGYNRNKEVFGPDAHIFNPERWLQSEGVRKVVPLGVYGNLMTFLGGVHACIGWKFAVQELQSFLVELINTFEFSMTDDAKKIRREACLVMVPTVEGQVDKGALLPLEISIASREGDEYC